MNLRVEHGALGTLRAYIRNVTSCPSVNLIKWYLDAFWRFLEKISKIYL